MGDAEEKFLAQFGSELYDAPTKEMVSTSILTGKKVMLYFSGECCASVPRSLVRPVCLFCLLSVAWVHHPDVPSVLTGLLID